MPACIQLFHYVVDVTLWFGDTLGQNIFSASLCTSDVPLCRNRRLDRSRSQDLVVDPNYS